MNWIKYFFAFPVLFGLATAVATSAEEVRIKRRQPTRLEADRIVSDIAMNDSLLQRGDIVVTDRGFFQYRGLAANGVTNDFDAIANPLYPYPPAKSASSAPARSPSGRKN